MSTDFVGFDEMRQRVRKAFESAALPDAVDRLYLVRNMIGKVRISVPEKLERDESCHGALRGLARELGGVMGAHGYLPDEADDTGVLFVSDGMLKLLDKEARPIPDLPGLPAHCTVYWAERLVTGSDWWTVRPPADAKRTARRWTLFGAKGGLGCTTTAAVLAREYARKGEQVLVVDLDLESPGLSSAMLDADARPEFGVTDWFVEDLVGQEGAVMEKMTATPAWARDLEGGVRIAPAHGRRPREYLAKLGRVYMSSRGKDWGSRLEKMLSGLEDACSPNLVLIESRNGLHDIAAAAIAAIDADVLMFATDSDSSWENYSILFRHWREYLFRNPPDGYKEAANRLRERLHIVSAMTPPSGDSYLNGFRKRSRRPFADNLYDDAPHDPLVVYWDRGFAAGASLCRFDDEAITRAYGSFLDDFEHSPGENGALRRQAAGGAPMSAVGNGSRRIDPKRIGARLREAREYLGFTQAAAEARADMPPTALSVIEDGQRDVGAAELARLAKLYRRPESGFTSGDAPDRSLPPDIARIAEDMPNLSARDRVELKRFAEYLRASAHTYTLLPGVNERIRKNAGSRSDVEADAGEEIVMIDGELRARSWRRLLEKHGFKRRGGGSVDIFDAITRLGLPLVFRPLDGLLGACALDPAPGILIAAGRPLAVQRQAAAQELCHLLQRGRPRLDDESLLRRWPFGDRKGYGKLEQEADAFAAKFLIRLRLSDESLADPAAAYQLSLRLGARFEPTWRALHHHLNKHDGIEPAFSRTLVDEAKARLLRRLGRRDCRGDIWLLTERELLPERGAETVIAGRRNDLLVMELQEHCGSGYIWGGGDFEARGFTVIDDEREALDAEGVGSPVIRRLVLAPEAAGSGTLKMAESRAWNPKEPLNRFDLTYDFEGPEEAGLPRAQRRAEAAP